MNPSRDSRKKALCDQLHQGDSAIHPACTMRLRSMIILSIERFYEAFSHSLLFILDRHEVNQFITVPQSGPYADMIAPDIIIVIYN
jgi:hypothetical protein